MKELYSSKNRLGDSSSLYLKQHSSNPVNWLPWNEKAFEEARLLDKPVLVSIGYSTCHWCHVMEEKNFSDNSVASIMNEKYINIKVDREEMPAVDSLYMDAVQAMTGRGGWPLHVILDHDKRPFFGGSYFPNSHWLETLKQISHAWENEREKIDTVSKNISEYFKKRGTVLSSSMPENPFKLFKESLFQYYDAEDPGFSWGGGGQKFPPTRILSVLLESGDKDLYEMAEKILEAMMDSGLHDRVGGGFHRYATDPEWRVPHFEKMLYDNAQLMGLYARAGALFNRRDFTETAESAAVYLKRDMKLYSGTDFAGYASAEDADDPSGEGSFYAWPPDEIRKLFPGKEGEDLILYWNLSGSGSVKGPGFEPVSGWIPHPRGSDHYGKYFFTEKRLDEIRKKLLEVRSRRPSPVRDGKVLTDLNALLLEGFSLLARYTGKDEYIKDTGELSLFLKNRLDSHGVVRGIGIDPYITDYAFLITGFTAAYSVTGNPELIEAAEKAAFSAVRDLYSEEGFFYTTAEKRNDLFERRPDSMDSQIPSGQNALLLGFSRLYLITGRDEWRRYSKGIIENQADLFSKIPPQFSTMLQALIMNKKGLHAVITGDPDDPGFMKLKKHLLLSSGADFPVITASSSACKDWAALEGRRNISDVQVLICSSTSCFSPVSDTEGLSKMLETL